MPMYVYNINKQINIYIISYWYCNNIALNIFITYLSIILISNYNYCKSNVKNIDYKVFLLDFSKFMYSIDCILINYIITINILFIYLNVLLLYYEYYVEYYCMYIIIFFSSKYFILIITISELLIILLVFLLSTIYGMYYYNAG